MNEVYIIGEAVTIHLWLLFCILYGKMTLCFWYYQNLSAPLYESLFEILMLSLLCVTIVEFQAGSGTHSVTIRWVPGYSGGARIAQ